MISDNQLLNLVENIKNGNTRLILVNKNGLERIYTKDEKDAKVDKSISIYNKPMYKGKKSLLGKNKPVKRKEKLKIINETLYNLNQMKSFILASEETDNIEDIRVDFCEMIKEISDDSYNIKGNIYDEYVDDFLDEDDSKQKIK